VKGEGEMNIDERIAAIKVPGYDGAIHTSDTSLSEKSDEVKQLIRDVLAEVKPERIANEEITDYKRRNATTRNNVLDEMEAKIKELGL
jgi:hypothetical protein